MSKLYDLRKKLSETIIQLETLGSVVKETLKQQYILIPQISDEELKFWSERIKPVITTRCHSRQHFLKMDKIHLRSTDLSCRAHKREKEPVDLGYLFDITTFHYLKNSYALCATYDETVAQIPSVFRDMVAGFEADPKYPEWFSSDVFMYKGYFIARTRLYTTEELIWGHKNK